MKIDEGPLQGIRRFSLGSDLICARQGINQGRVHLWDGETRSLLFHGAAARQG